MLQGHWTQSRKAECARERPVHTASDTSSSAMPLAFCNPAEKLHTDFIAAISNKEAHLTCYSMTTANEFVGRTEISDQFGARQGLLVGTPRVLCVPTRKLGFEVISPDGTVGGGQRAQ